MGLLNGNRRGALVRPWYEVAGVFMVASFGKRVDGPGGRRRIRRKTVSIHASASGIDGSRCVLIEDLCFTGARVRGRELPSQGSEILLRSGPRAILGRVAWERGDRRGIVFNGARG
jgi:hypothetical protein